MSAVSYNCPAFCSEIFPEFLVLGLLGRHVNWCWAPQGLLFFVLAVVDFCNRHHYLLQNEVPPMGAENYVYL